MVLPLTAAYDPGATIDASRLKVGASDGWPKVVDALRPDSPQDQIVALNVRSSAQKQSCFSATPCLDDEPEDLTRILSEQEHGKTLKGMRGFPVITPSPLMFRLAGEIPPVLSAVGGVAPAAAPFGIVVANEVCARDEHSICGNGR